MFNDSVLSVFPGRKFITLSKEATLSHNVTHNVCSKNKGIKVYNISSKIAILHMNV